MAELGLSVEVAGPIAMSNTWLDDLLD